MIQRIHERYGIEGGQLLKAVRHKQFKYMERMTETRSLCFAEIDGVKVWFIYSRSSGTAVTVLPPDCTTVQRALEKRARAGGSDAR